MAVTPRRWHHVTVKDVTWPEVTESDPEMTSFERSHLEVAVEGL